MEAIYATFAHQKLSQNLLARWSCSSVKKLPIHLEAKKFGLELYLWKATVLYARAIA